MFETILVGVGGFVGSAARYLVYKATETIPTDFPLATLTVNGLASFFLGLFMGISMQSDFIPE